MKGETRKFRVLSAIVGGGFSLREGQIVDEEQLLGYLDWLQTAGGVEEIFEDDKPEAPPLSRAYTA